MLLRRRSKTCQGVTAKAPDERFARIGAWAWAWAGTGIVLAVGNLSAFTGELASCLHLSYEWLPRAHADHS
ncbi:MULTISPECIES: hypothetical protein [Streptomyces]|uniref:hypothetical protein n=1 Tax=Streptomyces TaxID=1883 RepID=UPI001E2C9269|nr:MULTISPECIES: hypothetical protein [Streptomyces]UFQ19878.1 hypothetical protein J2N69_35700 [Streptomyces huasconensis]WCL89501.1 hypothetical protein PPN52_35645 [Streptomyces sp. JCM 35825]